MNTLILRDHKLVHEEVWAAREAQDRVVVVPPGFPDPTDYINAHKGGPGLFIHVDNEHGGFDLRHLTWETVDKRLSGTTMKPFAQGRVLAMFPNIIGYGLMLGRLYTLFNGGEVVPYAGSSSSIYDNTYEQKVETIYCVADYLVASGKTDYRGDGELKYVINVCKPLSLGAYQALPKYFPGVRVFHHFGSFRCGTIAFAERHMEPGEVGDLVVPAEFRGEELFVQSPSTYPWLDLGDGWCATGYRGRIEGQRLFIDGPVGRSD